MPTPKTSTSKQATLKANVADVHIGMRVIEGLQFEDGTFGIALQQLASMFQLRSDMVQNQIQSLLGKDASLVKVKTNREAIKGKRVRSAENALSLVDFERVLLKLYKAGNAQAESLVDDLVGLSITQLFNDAFGIKFELTARQQYLLERAAGKHQRKTLTNAVKDDLVSNAALYSPKAKANIYCNITNAVYIGFTGMGAKKLRKLYNIPLADNLRDHLTPESLAQLALYEGLCADQYYKYNGKHTIQQIVNDVFTKLPPAKPLLFI